MILLNSEGFAFDACREERRLAAVVISDIKQKIRLVVKRSKINSIDVDASGNTGVTSPILDPTSGNIFVEDSSGLLGYVRETFSTAGTCKSGSPPWLGSTSVSSSAVHVVTDAPIVDPSTEKVFAFYGNNGSFSAVIQSEATISASVTATLGSGTAHHILAGAFDNAYLTGNGGTGSIYICGSSTSATPTLQRIGFTYSGRVPTSPFAKSRRPMNPAVAGVTLASGNWQRGMRPGDGIV
jgi:hypothetical protein